MAESLEDRVKALEAQVRELQDVREITEIFDRWHQGCCGGFAGRQAGDYTALDYITEDATIELKGLHEPGKGPKGREAVTKFWDYFYGDNGPLPYVFQTGLGNIITVDGDEAVHESSMIVLSQFRGQDARLNLTLRRNYLRRTPEGWRIYKTTTDGGLGMAVPQLLGPLNRLPPQEERTLWTYEAEHGACNP
jgi:hypothetical protein